MKVTKKLFLVLLAGALVFAVTACSNGSDSDSGTTNTTEQTDSKSTSSASNTPVTKSDPSSKTYPFSGTTWKSKDNSLYKFVFGETTFDFSMGPMAIKGVGYSVTKVGNSYIAQSESPKIDIVVDSSEATTATVHRTEVDMKTYVKNDISETYIRQ